MTEGPYVATMYNYRHPMTITKVEHFKSDDSRYYICPRCEELIDRDYQNFCSNCGQRLNWNAHIKMEVIER